MLYAYRQALDATLVARDQVAAVAHQLEEKVQVMHSQLVQLPQLQHELKQLQEQQRQLDHDHARQMQVRTPTYIANGSMVTYLETGVQVVLRICPVSAQLQVCDFRRSWQCADGSGLLMYMPLCLPPLQARRILESELQDERAARAAAEEARAKAESDRSRLQLGLDDMAAQVHGLNV